MSKEPSVPRWRLQRIAEELGGEVKYLFCSDRTTTHNKIVIEYGHKDKEK